MTVEIRPLRIEGMYSIQPRVFRDTRGYFLETYSEREFIAEGLTARFVQDNQSQSHRGVLRGLHFQKSYPQGKLVRAIAGEVFDVAVDLRSGSTTFGQWVGLILSGNRQNQVYIPPGFAHGSVVLSEEAVLAYKCTAFYHPEEEGGLRWDDPTLAIDWPDLGMEPLLSAKDAALPLFDPQLSYFPAPGASV